MMRFKRSHTWKALTIGLMGIALMAFAAGCGDQARLPVASTEVGDEAPDASSSSMLAGGKLVFSPRALAIGAAKTAGEVTSLTKKARKNFHPKKNGKMSVTFPKYGDNTILRVKKATFSVKKNSIGGLAPNNGKKYRIKMKVTSGTTLDDIVIAFSPAGLAFKPQAELKLLLKGTMDVAGAAKLAGGDNESEDMSDEGKGKEAFIYHISKDGKVTLVPVKVTEKRSGWLIKIKVPGFSEFDFDYAEADGP
jgi:hypothetical protein